MKIIAASTMSVLDSCLVCTSTSTRGLQVLLWSIERSNRCRTASHPTTSYVVSIHVYADVMCGSTALVVRPSQSGKYCSPGPLLRALRGIVQPPGFNTLAGPKCRSRRGGGRSRGEPTASHVLCKLARAWGGVRPHRGFTEKFTAPGGPHLGHHHLPPIPRCRHHAPGAYRPRLPTYVHRERLSVVVYTFLCPP